MFRKFIIILLTAVMLCQAPMVLASDLTSAFSELLPVGGTAAINEPGHYQSAARNSFVAGGVEMRFPKKAASAQLFSLTPPTITAGCNGVSAFFGGFSFISGAEFETLVKSIASGAALGFVTMLTLKSLCPQCADVVQSLKNAVQAASRLAIDSCKLGQEAFKKFSGQANDFSTELCGTNASGTGIVNDFMKSMNSTCTSIAASMDSLVASNPAASGTSDEAKANHAALSCRAGVGNTTWYTLTQTTSVIAGDDNYNRNILLMNMMGAVMKQGSTAATCEQPDGSWLTTSESNNEIFCAPQISAVDVRGAFMCGTDKDILKSSSTAVTSYCQKFFDNAGTALAPSYTSANAAKIYTCDDAKDCLKLSLVRLDASAIATGQGFLPQVMSILTQAVTAVQNNTALSTQAIGLIQMAPYPLYQAINAAAVYPAAATDFLNSIGLMVAEAITAAYMDDFLRFEGRGLGACTNEKQVKRVLEVVATARASLTERSTLMAQNLAAEAQVKEMIRSINLNIQRQVMSTELLNQNQVSASFAHAVTATNAGASTATTTTSTTN